MRRISLKASKFIVGQGISLAFSILLIVPALAESAPHTYPSEYTQQYLKDCMAVSMTEGLAEPEAKKLCDCTLAKFQQQYSLEAFKELNAKSETDETAANKLFEVGELCFEEILYE